MVLHYMSTLRVLYIASFYVCVVGMSAYCVLMPYVFILHICVCLACVLCVWRLACLAVSCGCLVTMSIAGVQRFGQVCACIAPCGGFLTGLAVVLHCTICTTRSCAALRAADLGLDLHDEKV